MPETPAEPILVPHADLSQEALRGVVESFILREGTDYGLHEMSLEDKVRQILQQLERREARIVFDPETETIDIIVARQARG